MIDIIIDCSNKEINQIKKTLGSISYQLHMPPIQVHLSSEVSEEIINHFRNFIDIDTKPDNINGKHLMYINAGDALANPYALKMLYEHKEYDVVVSNGVKRDKEGMQCNIYDDTDSFNGKLYKTEFLKNKKINYSNKFVLNKLCMMNVPQIYFLDQKIYFIEETEENIKEYIDNIKETVRIGTKLQLYSGIYQLSTETLVDMYHKYLNGKIEIDIRELRELASVYNKYKENEEVFIKTSKYQFTIKDIMPEISFNEFIKKVTKI